MRLHLPRLCGAADHRGRKWVDHTHCSVDVGYSVLKDERSVVYTHFQSRGLELARPAVSGAAPHPHSASLRVSLPPLKGAGRGTLDTSTQPTALPSRIGF